MTAQRTSPFLNEGWLEAQRAYWDAWATLSRRTLESAPPDRRETGSSPWADALENWWKAVASVVPPQGRELFDPLIAQGKAYLRMTEAFTAMLQNMGVPPTSGDAWQERLRSSLSNLTGAFSKSQAEAAGGMRGPLSFWGVPLDAWARTMSGAPAMPGDWMENFRTENWGKFVDHFHGQTERYLFVPALGYTREWQEQAQEGVRLSIEYARALRDYTNVFNRLGVDTADHLYRKIVRLTAEGDAITSVRQLYDLWVDAAEDAYAAVVTTEEYSEIYARMINAQMALTNHTRNVVDQAIGMLDLPTRKGLNTVQQRQQELRREIRALRDELDALRADAPPTLRTARAGRSADRNGKKTRSRATRKRTAAGEPASPSADNGE